MIVIDTDTEHQIYYLTNDLRLHDEDRETTLKIKITDITTEVFRSDRTPERGYYFDWYIASKLSIKDHQWQKWERPHVNDKEEIKNTEEVNTVCCEGIY